MSDKTPEELVAAASAWWTTSIIDVQPGAIAMRGYAIQDLIGGQIDLMFDNLSSISPQLKNARLKVLAVTGAHRSALFPDIPTMAESGVAGYDVVAWGGPARLYFHGILPLKAGVHPVLGPVRINLTFRKAAIIK